MNVWMYEWTTAITHYITVQTNGVELEWVCRVWGVCVWEQKDGLSVYHLYVHIACGDITAQRSYCPLIHTHRHTSTQAHKHTHGHCNVSSVVYREKEADQSQLLVVQWCHWADEEMASEEFDVILPNPHLLRLLLLFSCSALRFLLNAHPCSNCNCWRIYTINKKRHTIYSWTLFHQHNWYIATIDAYI